MIVTFVVQILNKQSNAAVSMLEIMVKVKRVLSSVSVVFVSNSGIPSTVNVIKVPRLIMVAVLWQPLWMVSHRLHAS
jgi:hypothetical protein